MYHALKTAQIVSKEVLKILSRVYFLMKDTDKILTSRNAGTLCIVSVNEQ